ncbi:DMT family transporter [Amaricoccus macauensis]|uniref:DMT family transporter n=1 Tax=Amaricoccus macauensis TaxID=57001 RepID=UPI003C7C3AF7
MSQTSNPKLGIILMILAMAVFAIQDGLSRYLAEHYHVMTVVMIRFWVFGAFVILFFKRQPGGLAQVARSGALRWQILRGVLLVFEIMVIVIGFVALGLIESHAIFAVYPLLVAALAGPVLGEYVGWRRAAAILVGLVGVLIILRPGGGVFSPVALIPFVAALMFALYALLTRFVSRADSAATSFFYTGVAGAAAVTVIGPFFWDPIHGWLDWTLMLSLSFAGLLGHFLMIKAYEYSEAGAIQPFAYFQLVFVSIIGVSIFGERPDTWTIAGTAMILSAGVYTIIRSARTR